MTWALYRIGGHFQITLKTPEAEKRYSGLLKLCSVSLFVHGGGETTSIKTDDISVCAVSVSELMVTASQRHVIPLQGRPYEEDQVRASKHFVIVDNSEIF